MTTITYTSKLNATAAEIKTINATDYKQLCKLSGSNYEVLPDDRPIKLYFDIDIKGDADEYEGHIDMQPHILRIALDTLTDFCVQVVKVEPDFTVKTANSENFKDWKSGAEKYALSIHIIINNVILIKAEQKRLIQKFNQFVVKNTPDLADYIGEGNLLFDEAVYDKNRKFRSLYASKPDENRPFILERGTFQNSCISAFIPDDAVLYEPPVESVVNHTAASTESDCSDNDENKFAVELLFESGLLHKLSGDYHTWRDIGWILRNEFGNVEGAELFHRFSKLSPKYDKHECQDFWDTIDENAANKLKIGSLMKMCKDVGGDQYKVVQRKIMEQKNKLPAGCLIDVATLEPEPKEKLYISLETLEKGENDVARHISQTLIQTLVFCNNRWYLFDQKTCLWRLIQTPSAMIITTIQTYIDESKISLLQRKLATDDEEEKKKYTAYEKKYTEFYKQVGKGSFTNQIIKILQTYLFDGDFERKLDTTPYLVAYKNGMFDLKTGLFRAGLQSSDYLTQTIPHNYEKATDADILAVKHELLKICNNDPQHLEYYLSSLGYAMTGDSSREQSFWNIRGQKASNGKSVVFDALVDIIPNYIVKMESDIFEVNYGSRHKEISTWKGVRIGYVNELSKKRQDENLLKELADGTCMRFKVMYGGMDTMPITLKLWIVGNSTMKVNADNGIKRRLKMLQFDSEFIADLEEDDYATCQFKKDLNFKALLQTKYKHAIMELIYQYSKKYVDNHYKLCDYPAAWLEDCEDVARDNNKFEEYFYNNFEIDPNGTVSKRAVDSIVSGYKADQIIIKDELKKMRIAFTYDSKKKAKRERTNGCYTGFKEIIHEDEFDNETDQETTEL